MKRRLNDKEKLLKTDPALFLSDSSSSATSSKIFNQSIISASEWNSDVLKKLKKRTGLIPGTKGLLVTRRHCRLILLALSDKTFIWWK